MKKYKKIVKILLLIMLICILSSNSYALELSGKFQGSLYNGDNPFSGNVTSIKSIATTVGGACAIIMLVYIGIKFLLASPDGKADLKKEMPLWCIGCVLLFMPKLQEMVEDTVKELAGYTDLEAAIGKGASIVLGAMQATGASIAIIMLVYFGIKYVISSPDGKAEIKKHIPAYGIGAIILFGAPWIVKIVIATVSTM